MTKFNRKLHLDYRLKFHGVTGGGCIDTLISDNALFLRGVAMFDLNFLSRFFTKWGVFEVIGKEIS